MKTLKMISTALALAPLAVVACGGGAADTTQTNTAATTTASTAATPTAPSSCKVLGDRVDAFSTEAGTADAHTVEGLKKMQGMTANASHDIDGLQLTGDVAAIGHDASAHLTLANKMLGDLATILDGVQTAAKKLETDQKTVQTCALPPAREVGTMCGGKKTGDCVAVMAQLAAWGSADRDHQSQALAALKALKVTDAKLKVPYGKIVVCVQPLADGLADIETQTSKLKGIADTGDAREKAIDARFKTACGRGLFTK